METTKSTDLLRRVKSVNGHMRAVERMIEEDAYCIDIIKQIQAVQAALNKISVQILDNHLHSCVVTAVNSDDTRERERVLVEIADVFEAATKV